MATPTIASRTRRRLTATGVITWALVILVLTAVAMAAWFYDRATSSLPQVDGRLLVPGISAPVSVIRDAQGVPHIRASRMEDLLFAQGYVTAQDRLWQMDTLRRAALGELAEAVGPQALEHDRQQRLILIRPSAERALAALPAETRLESEAYTAGVNAFIDSNRHRLPIEFRLLQYEPRPWTPVDSLAIGLLMHQMLTFERYRVPLRRERIQAKIGPELAADLYPNTSWHDHPPGADGHEEQKGPSDEEEDDDSDAQPLSRASLEGAASGLEFLLDWELPGGSNNWVVSGSHTVSHQPLLSNDMHLEQQMPSLWYEAQLQIAGGTNRGPAAGFDVSGFTLPGLPFVLVGHNQRIGWGATNLGADVEDLFIETFNPQGEYQTPEGWRKPEYRRETIQVKGQADVTFEVVVTRHGPIISDLIPGESRKLALAWAPIMDPAYVGYPFLELDSAQDWKQFRQALSKLGGPALNMVYADVDGHIGYQATGRIPVRASRTGGVPVPGADNVHEWTGTVPYDKLPSVFDPPSGIIATANARITPDHYPYLLSSEWMAPYRTERIYRVLESGRQFAPDDMLALEMDVQSEFDHFCADRFVYAIDHAKNPSARAREAADLLRSWDGQVKADSAAATVTIIAREQLWRLLLEPKLGEDYRLYHWGMQSVALENILLRQPERWLSPKYPNYEEMLAAAVEAAVASPEAPKSVSSWAWGKARPLVLQHRVLGKVPVLRHWSGPGHFEQSGDGYTVKQMGHGELYAYQQAPSERMTIDFSNLDATTMNIVTGESGQVFSPHFLDQWPAWTEGRSFVSPFSDAAVNQAKRHELHLEPR